MEHLELSKATYVLEEEQAPACLVGLDGCIVYCNPAWDLFARENGGDPAALGQAVSGAPRRTSRGRRDELHGVGSARGPRLVPQ